jgi:hypothetical protein
VVRDDLQILVIHAEIHVVAAGQASLIWPLEARQDAQKRGLAASVGADDAEALPAHHEQIEPGEEAADTERLAEPLRLHTMSPAVTLRVNSNRVFLLGRRTIDAVDLLSALRRAPAGLLPLEFCG